VIVPAATQNSNVRRFVFIVDFSDLSSRKVRQARAGLSAAHRIRQLKCARGNAADRKRMKKDA
jgi:hypothetical protein